ncbi:MAG: elongation factor G [Kiritimatiellae bacterium]|nr:elongation factor G [Kiritimatiellia bacterium]
MKDIAINDVRTFVLLGHTGSGKTTLCDAVLYKTGLTDRMGLVSAGTSLSDFTETEISRKSSVYAQSFTTVFNDGGKKSQIVIIDSPGVDDFAGQVICACRAVNSALITVDAAAGIQVGTTRAWRRVQALAMPRGIVITGLDKENTSFTKTIGEIQNIWGEKCLPVIVFAEGKFIDVLSEGAVSPTAAELVEKSKNALIECAAEGDDAMLEKYLGGEKLTADELQNGLRKAVLKGTLIPVFAAMALKNEGLDLLLQKIVQVFPGPADAPAKDAAGKSVNPAPDAPFVGHVWSAVTDPYAGKLVYIRVCGGTLRENMEVSNAAKGHKERIGPLLVPQGKKPAVTTEARAGDIIALPKLKNTTINDVLCAVNHKAEFTPIVFPNPVISMAVSAKEQSDEDKIGTALSRVAEDDPTIRVERRVDTNEIIIAGMGDAHLDVALSQMKKRSNVTAEYRTPKVPYKETVTGLGEGHYKHKKQSGGRGQYAEVYCKVAPKKPDEEWFVDEVVGGVIPRNFLPACEKGFMEAMPHGVLAGYPIVDVKVTVYDGSYHDVDSSEIAFKIAASRAMKEAVSKAKPVLLEPIMTARVAVPEQFMGDINGDLNHRRGRILGIEIEDGLQVIVAEVPMAEMFRYCSELRSITGGRGSFEMSFARYDVVPSNIAQKIIASVEKTKEEEV